MLNERIRPYLRPTILGFLITVLLVTACRGSENDYKILTVSNRIARFSFEYRSYYTDTPGPQIVDSAGQRFTYVTVLAARKKKATVNLTPGGNGDTVQMSYVPASIQVSASDATSNPEWRPSDWIERSIKGWGTWPEFKLLERSTTTVAGAQAEFIVYQIDASFPGWPLEYRAEAYFDRGGLQWTITTKTNVEMAEVVRADFDHVLQTLKILD